MQPGPNGKIIAVFDLVEHETTFANLFLHIKKTSVAGDAAVKKKPAAAAQAVKKKPAAAAKKKKVEESDEESEEEDEDENSVEDEEEEEEEESDNDDAMTEQSAEDAKVMADLFDVPVAAVVHKKPAAAKVQDN